MHENMKGRRHLKHVRNETYDAQEYKKKETYIQIEHEST